jgi:hypothetical protein
LASAVVASAGDAVTPGQVTADYDVRYGPLTILSVRATTESQAGRYRTTTEARTVGGVALLFPWQAAATSEGLIDAGALRPLMHRSDGIYRGQRRSVTIEYDRSGAVVAAIEPPALDDYRDPVPVALQQETVDPLTATLSALASRCQGRVRVFDGRRRYDIELADLGDVDVERSLDTLYSGPARCCRSEMHPIAGFWNTEPRHDERPARLDSWVATPRPGLAPLPVYLELSSPRGTLTIHLTAVDTGRSEEAPPP